MTAGQKPKGFSSADPDRRVCFCYCISEGEIVQAIKEGADSLLEIRRRTSANTGCGGCAEDVRELLKMYSTKPVPTGET